MQADLLTPMIQGRAADMRAIILPFVLSHTGILLVLGLGGSGLEDSGIQLALAAFTVLGSLWAVLWIDGAMADVAAGIKDMPEEQVNSHIGRNFTKAPFAVFRLINLVIVALIVIAEVMAIY